mmetsp:Transcript_66010/g.208587  ORF Transcript_66010/g.208587 Transcript_66010/m.208587 type:complete len:441 (-) Transcript_66010:218-1540(-)
MGCPADYGKALCLKNECEGKPWCKFTQKFGVGRGLCHCECGWCAVPPSESNGWKWSCLREEGVTVSDDVIEQQRLTGNCPADLDEGQAALPVVQNNGTAQLATRPTVSASTTAARVATPGLAQQGAVPAADTTTALATSAAAVAATSAATASTGTTTRQSTTATEAATTATTVTTVTTTQTITTSTSTTDTTTVTSQTTTFTTVTRTTSTPAYEDDSSWMLMAQSATTSLALAVEDLHLEEEDVFATTTLSPEAARQAATSRAPTTATTSTQAATTTTQVATTTTEAPTTSTGTTTTTRSLGRADRDTGSDLDENVGSDSFVPTFSDHPERTTTPAVFWRLFASAPSSAPAATGGRPAAGRRGPGLSLSNSLLVAAAAASAGLLLLLASRALPARARRMRRVPAQLIPEVAEEPLVESRPPGTEDAGGARCFDSRDLALE